VRTIARSVGIGRTTVAEYLRRTSVIGITWPVPAEIDDAELERRLFAPAGFNKAPIRVMPDWQHVHTELRRRGVTLLLLWEEYRADHADGYGYSRFCDLYIEWRRCISATMRQTHVAGEKLFVDYGGDTVPVFDGVSGEERQAHVFVAVLGASNYTYAEARWSEELADWIGAHVNALAFLGGAPKLLVCDNLRAGVTAACPTSLASTVPTRRWQPITAPPCCQPGFVARVTRMRLNSPVVGSGSNLLRLTDDRAAKNLA
jgi:transposase